MDRNLEVKAWLKKTLPNELANIFCGAEGQGSGCRWATMPVFNQGDFDQATNFKSFVTESQRGADAMSHPSSDAEEPAYLRNDPGLACLASQLRRINAQIMRLERLKERVADAEEWCKDDLTAATSSGGSIDSSSSSKDEAPGRNASATTKSSLDQDAKGQWVKQYDTEVQAEYWYNNVTGEASWLDPRYGSMAV
jgi:hypothetical protein